MSVCRRARSTGGKAAANRETPEPSKLSAPAAVQRRTRRALLTRPTWQIAPRACARRAHGITTYTGVAEQGWLDQILQFGWCAEPLGLPRTIDGMTLGALRIEITPETPSLLAAKGIHAPGELDREAA